MPWEETIPKPQGLGQRKVISHSRCRCPLGSAWWSSHCFECTGHMAQGKKILEGLALATDGLAQR